MNNLDKETVIAYAEMLMGCTPGELRDQMYELYATSSELSPEDYDLLRVPLVVRMVFDDQTMVEEFSNEEANKVLDLMENFLVSFQTEFYAFINDEKDKSEVLTGLFFKMSIVSSAIQKFHGIKLVPDA